MIHFLLIGIFSVGAFLVGLSLAMACELKSDRISLRDRILTFFFNRKKPPD